MSDVGQSDILRRMVVIQEAIVDSTSTATLDSRVEDLLGAVESAKREVRGET